MFSLLCASLLSMTVRVDSSAGAPRLLVDDRPVRARMFWGAPQSMPLPIGPQARQIQFEFTPALDEPGHGTLHFRFGDTPGEVFLDDVQVTDLDAHRDVIPRCDFEAGPKSFDRDWTFWPTGAQNTVGSVAVEAGAGANNSAGLHVRLGTNPATTTAPLGGREMLGQRTILGPAPKAPPGARWPDFHIYHHPNLTLIKAHRHRVTLWVRAEPARGLRIAFYRPGHPFVYLGGPDKDVATQPFDAQIKLAAEAGVDFVSFPVSMPWPEPGKSVDWAAVDAQCQRVLDVNPRALLLPRVPMDPPGWWRKAYPDDTMVWEDGPHEKTAAAVASPRYRHDAAERLAALATHLEEKFGPHTAGYHPCGQNTGEWFYQDTWGNKLSGYSPAELTAWRQWLAKRYLSDDALRRAWNVSEATRASAPLPTPAARHAAPAGVFRDPSRERAIIDFNEFQQEMMSDCVCHFAHALRAATHGRKLVVFFYGYVFEFGAIQTGPAVAGHYGLRRVLDCPDVDVLCSPISYFDRALGQSGPSMTAAESVALAGKLWLNEDDTSTYLSSGTPPGHKERTSTLADTNALLVRNVAQEALRNFGTWWMDLGATGWFNDPGMWAEMVRLKALDEPLLSHPRPFRPEVAAVIDQRSMLRVAAKGTAVTRPGVYTVRAPLGRMGAPYGQYLLDDVTAGRVSAKMYVMLTTWCLSAQQRQQLLQATRGSTRIWCYAPGYFDDDRPSPDAMRQLTGFRLEPITVEKALAAPTELGKSLGLEQPLGAEGRVQPLFAAADATPDEVLARYSDGSAAVAMRRTADGLSLFVGPPGLTSQLLRLAARRSGVHLLTQVDCNVYANGPFVAVHTAQDGPLEIDVGRAGPVVDVLTGQTIGQGPKIMLPLKRFETRVLRSAE